MTEQQEPTIPAASEEEKAALLARWYELKQQLASVKHLIEEERELRKQVQDTLFPNPKEGVNNYALQGGWSLKFTFKIDRKVDEPALPAVYELLRARNLIPESYIDYKPQLNTKEYKELKKQYPEAALQLEQALIIKPGSHTLELVAPKETR